jgi:hypothetical protein
MDVTAKEKYLVSKLAKVLKMAVVYPSSPHLFS